MTEADNNMGSDSKEAKSRLEDIKYFTSLFLGTLCIVCVFGFLFLVPFVLLVPLVPLVPLGTLLP